MFVTKRNELNKQKIESLMKDIPERKSLGDYVYEKLKQAIIDGEITPGSRIIEGRIANILGISRTPVREAIHKLDRSGFLERLPSGGFTVSSLTREEIEEVFGIRSVLESYAARLAAINYNQEELKLLEAKLKEYKSCLEKGQLDALNDINTEFHDTLYTLSRSPKLVEIIGNLKDHISRFRKILLNDARLAKVSDYDHQRMLEAMKRRDPDGVEKLVKEHILRGQKMVLKKYQFDMEEE